MDDEIARDCRSTLALVKGLPVEEVTPERTLDELGLDSLDRVSLSFDLEEKYGVEIPESRLAEIKTVEDVITQVREALLKKATKTGSASSATSTRPGSTAA